MNLHNQFYKYVIGLVLAAPMILAWMYNTIGGVAGETHLVGTLTLLGLVVLIIGAIFAYIATKTRSTMYRAAVGVAFGSALLLVWANGAVGVIGSEENPANLIYFVVLLVGIICAIIERFEALGMAHVMFSAALIMALIPLMVLVADGMQHAGFDLSKVWGLIAPHGFFFTLFGASAVLFRNAAISKKEHPVNEG